MKIPKIKPENKVPGWRILRRGDVIRATDMQYTDGGFCVLKEQRELFLLICNVPAIKTRVGNKWADSMYYGNLYYRKVSLQ